MDTLHTCQAQHRSPSLWRQGLDGQVFDREELNLAWKEATARGAFRPIVGLSKTMSYVGL